MNTQIRHGRSRAGRNTCGDFVCMVCHNFVSAEAALSGVQHRNHCPYCLSSRHLDLFKAGDRLSACKASMRPVALSLKKTCKKYAGENQGEVMLVHLCAGCGKISINRIAADDDSENLRGILEASYCLDNGLKSLIAIAGIAIITRGDHHLLQFQLFGYD